MVLWTTTVWLTLKLQAHSTCVWSQLDQRLQSFTVCSRTWCSVPKEIAGLMLSGLISDTLLLKSPTTHPSDKVIAPELAELAGVNLEEYGLAMLKAGTNLASKSAEELIDIDAKTF